MKRLLFIPMFLCFSVFCFALGVHEEYEKIEKKIMENPQVVSVIVSGMGGNFGPPYYADIVLTGDRTLRIVEFDKTLSGERIGIDRIGIYEFGLGRYIKKIPDEDGIIHGYRVNEIRANVLSLILEKDIFSIDDIINNYDEIHAFTEKLAKETPEERSNRRILGVLIQNDPGFSKIFGNFESDECWGQVFARVYSKDNWHNPSGYYWEGMFADE